MARSLEEVNVWIAEHGARCEEKWAVQSKHNERTDEVIKSLTDKLSSLERRVIWLCAAAAAGGGFAGQVLPMLPF